MRCDIQSHGECDCASSQCHQQIKTTAPVIEATWRGYAAVFAFGLVVAIIFAGTLHMLNQKEIQLKQEARI